jgi:hypothetical protein
MSATKNKRATREARPAARKRSGREDGLAMSIVLRDVPPGYNWGWYSREDPRMHLQTVNRPTRNQYKVWLERAGRRVFEVEGKVPAKVLKRLEAEVGGRRSYVEGWWVEFMIRNGWLELKVAGSKVVLTAYSDTPNRYTRTIDLRDYFIPEVVAKIQPADVVLSEEMAAVEIWPSRPEQRREHVRLSTILWEG